MLWRRGAEEKTNLNIELLAKALTISRLKMQPMDFFHLIFDEGDIRKNVSVGFVKTYFTESIHVALDNYGEDENQKLFGPLFELGFNPSDDGLHYYAEWLDGPEGEKQFIELISVVQKVTYTSFSSVFSAFGPKFLEQSLAEFGSCSPTRDFRMRQQSIAS